ncbi:MAG: hypothetical protein HON48_14235 [Desulfobacula sp.]|jgi:hypothetical protein|nr:hypothetical protein [Desulfobacula sp.]
MTYRHPRDEIGASLMGVANTLNSIQAMGQRNTTFKHQQDDRKTRLDEKDQHRSALGTMQETGKLPEGTPADIGISVKEDYLKGLDTDLGIADAQEADGVRGRSSEISTWMSENPGQPFDKIPTNLTAGVVGQKSLANVIGLYGKTAEAQKTFMQNRLPIIEKHAKNFFNSRNLVNDALKAGKTDMAVNGLVQMSKELTFSPYQLGEYDPETKSFSLEYFDRRTGKLQNNGTKHIDEVITEMNALGEKEFISVAASKMEAKRQENLVAEANPRHGKTSTGKSTLVIPQVKVTDQTGGVDIRVKDEKTGELLGEYKSWDAFYSSGNSVEDLKREKDLAGIDSEKALAIQRTASANKSDAEKNYYTKKTNALGDKVIDEKLYDDKGNSYTAKSKAEFDNYIKMGLTRINPKRDKGIDAANVKSFAMQAAGSGMEQDLETGDVSGTVRATDMPQLLKIANGLGLSLYDEGGQVIDENGWMPGGKKEAFKVSVLPPGTKRIGVDPVENKKKGDKFNSSAKKEDELEKKPNAMGTDVKETKGKQPIYQMSKEEIKNIYRFSAMPGSDEPGTTPLTIVQGLINKNVHPDFPKWGEGKIGKALRDAGIETDLQKIKTIVKTLKSRFENATEDQIIKMIKQSAKKGL